MDDRSQNRILIDAVLIGIVGGLGAQVFLWMLRVCSHIFLLDIAGYRAPQLLPSGGVSPAMIGPHGYWLIPVVTTLGGVLAGVLVYGFAPEAEGHGTDTVVRAYHFTGGKIRSRVAPIKLVASAITIGSGGSAGREGPIALIAAGIGSTYAQWLRRDPEETRMLVLMGMAAGLSAIFRSPIGTAVFAVEVLYSGAQFETGALLYCMIASVVAYAVNVAFVGWAPLFHVTAQLQGTGLMNYARYAGLGAAAGVVAAVFPAIFYRTRDAFAALPIPPWTKPALGGLLLGLMALKLPQVLGGGYGWIQGAINGSLALHLLLLLMVAKIVALSLSVASGGSGGVFAPSLFIGAMLGAAFAGQFAQFPGGFVIVGMAAVFGAAAGVPLATLLMVSEMTGGYQLLVPAGLAVAIAYLVQRRLTGAFRYASLYEAQVAGPFDSPAHRAEEVRTAMNLISKGKVTLPPNLSHLDLADLLRSGMALDLSGGLQLVGGALRTDSPWAGKEVRSRRLEGALVATRIVALLRGRSVLPVRADTVLLPGDRILVATPAEARPAVEAQLVPAPGAGGAARPLTA
jgi:chloride channel protein, CIC family